MKITPPKDMTPGPWHYTWPNGKVLGSATLEPDSTEHTPAPVIHSHHRTKATDEEKANAKAIAATPQTLNANQFGLSLALEMHQHQDVLDALTNAGLIDAFLEQIERARQALTLAGYTITP